MRSTVLSYLGDFIARGDETAFAYRSGLRMVRWSYERTAWTAFQFARELEGRAVGKGDPVLLWAKNSPQWVAIFFGCLLRGAIVVPLDVQSDPAFVTRVLDQTQAKLIVCDSDIRPRANLSIPTLLLDEDISALSRHSHERYSATPINEDDLVELIFTSGTTAEPKGVPLTHRNLLANLTPLENEIKRYLKWERLIHPLRFLNLVPLSHVFGQFMGMFLPQLLSGEVVFQESLNATQIAETVKRERVSVIVAVPRVLETLREKIERLYAEHDKLAQLKTNLEVANSRHFIWRWWKFRGAHRLFGWKFWALVCGGAALDSETENFWRRLGFAVIQGYGMTETAALISVNHPFKTARGSIGQALPGQEIKLAEDGEILVRGPNVSSGYWERMTEPEGGDPNGWFRTGDIGELDERGNIYFKGRKKEVIVTAAGLNIYPNDIEGILDRQPEIKASVVIQADGPHGPEPLAVLILRHEDTEPREVITRANELLAEYQRVRRWFVWPGEDFPRTPTEKIRKQVVAAAVRADLAGSVPFSGTYEEPLAKTLERVTKEPLVDLDPSTSLGTDLKLDSLARVELLSALEDRYQVEIDEAAFTDATTVGQIEKIIRESRLEDAKPYPYPRWQHRWPLRWLRIVLLYGIAFTAVRILGWPRIKGKEHLNGLQGPLIFVSNHVTMTDHALVLFALPARFRTKMVIAQDGEVLREWRHPKNANVFRRGLNLIEYFLVVLFFNVFSLPQKSGFRHSFRFAGEMIDRGSNLMLFPEGERTKHGHMNTFRLGAGLLIKQLQVPVVPVRIDGLWQLKQAGRHFARPGQISVSIGEPVRYSSQDAPERIATDLEQRVKAI